MRAPVILLAGAVAVLSIMLISLYLDFRDYLGMYSLLEARIEELSAYIDAVIEQPPSGAEEEPMDDLYRALSLNVSRLEEEVSRVSEELRSMEERLSKLESLVAEIRTRAEAVAEGAGDSVAEAVAKVQPWYYVFTDTEGYSWFIRGILEVAEKQGSEIASKAGIEPGEPLGERVWKLARYIAINLMYVRDPAIRVPRPDGSIDVWSDSIQLPVETMLRGSGDCEDLALLVYGVLKATSRPSEEIYFVAIEGKPIGHGGVIAIDRDTKTIYLVDPTIPLVNNYAMLAEVKVNNRAYYIPYMFINPVSKRNIPFKMVYLDIVEYIKTGKPSISPYPAEIGADIGDILRYWLELQGITPLKYYVIGATELKSFDSDKEVTEWLLSKLK